MSGHDLVERTGIAHRRQFASGHSFLGNQIGGNARVHFGDVFQNPTFNLNSESQTLSVGPLTLDQGFTYSKPAGLCLGKAPYISPDLFVGRESEIKNIHGILQPEKKSTDQRRLVLGGVGGIGKTQLAIAYARHHHNAYESIFWLNAASETTLKTSYQLIAESVFDIKDHQAVSAEQILIHVRRWLSDLKNSRWLLIFDNYDEPESYDLKSYLPYATHGSIIVTTRLPDQVSGQRFSIQPLGQIGHGLQILETRSQRSNIADDTYAQRLAERLAGFPLALATAGAYLHKSTWSFQRYLEEYENKWNIAPRRPLQLREYQDRTLYTTWDLSYCRLEQEDANAAQLLKLLAYFDHHAIWEELFQAGMQPNLPEWLVAIVGDSCEFETSMRVLVDYCFLEVQITIQSYSMHTCVHDWTLAGLNNNLDPWMYWYALQCVANSINVEDPATLIHTRYARLAAHATRLTHSRFGDVGQKIAENRLYKVFQIAQLLRQQTQFTAAEVMYMRVLAGYEDVFGQNHLYTLSMAHNLGILSMESGKLAKAKEMYMQALSGFEDTLGPDHRLTLDTVSCLGDVYFEQGRLQEAKEMHTRALSGFEEAVGPDHMSTLDAVCCLGNVYSQEGNLMEAEAMFMRALTGQEKLVGREHISIWPTLNNLGNLYLRQGKLVEAEAMFMRALSGQEKSVGPEHISIWPTLNNLGSLYVRQGKLEEAEIMHMRALTGQEKSLGPDHITTLNTVWNIGYLYIRQGKLDQAEEIFLRLTAEYEKAAGPNHTATLNAVRNLAKIWSEGVKANHKTSHAASRGVACLIQSLHKWDRAFVDILYLLARALLWIKDEENAGIAFSKFRGTCDGCTEQVRSAQAKHICRKCDNLVLCNDCMAKYEDKSLALPGCIGHEYFDVGSIQSESLQSPNEDQQASMDRWINKLKEKYPLPDSR